ncbi:MAG TPA: hypothetical protein VK844_02375, partial [Hyphomicrobiales bacterium]|nr:hypothetical protein [Hyphomicrobiales bacterium]
MAFRIAGLGLMMSRRGLLGAGLAVGGAALSPSLRAARAQTPAQEGPAADLATGGVAHAHGL